MQTLPNALPVTGHLRCLENTEPESSLSESLASSCPAAFALSGVLQRLQHVEEKIHQVTNSSSISLPLFLFLYHPFPFLLLLLGFQDARTGLIVVDLYTSLESCMSSSFDKVLFCSYINGYIHAWVWSSFHHFFSQKLCVYYFK